MKKLKNFFKFNREKAFTLAEMLCAIGISAIVILTVYTMMMSAQQTFMRLNSASKNTGSYRFLVNSFRESMQYASRITTNAGVTDFLTVPTFKNGTAVTDVYYVSDTGAVLENVSYATKIDDAPTPGANSYDLFKTDGTNTFLVLSNVKQIYYSVENNESDANGAYQKLNLGIIYDEVLNDNKNQTVRRKRKMLCFSSKGI